MHCPNCSYPAQTGVERCGRCNYKMPAGKQPLAQAAPHSRIPCRNCHHENLADAARCEQCNVKLQPAVRSAPAPVLYNQPFTINRYAYGHEQ